MKKKNGLKNAARRGMAWVLTAAMLMTSDLGTIQTVFAADTAETPVTTTETAAESTPAASKAAADTPEGQPTGMPAAELSGDTGEADLADNKAAEGTVTADPKIPAAADTKAETISLTGKIVYMDDGTISRKSVDLQLYANGVKQEQKVTIADDGTSYNGKTCKVSSYSFKDLPKKDSTGKVITYAIKDAAYDAAAGSQTLFYMDANSNVVTLNANNQCETANANLVYVGRSDLAGTFEIALNGQDMPDTSGIKLDITAENSEDLAYAKKAEATVISMETAAKTTVPGMPVSGTWKVSNCLQYNPATGNAITYRGQVASGVENYSAEYDNSSVSGKESRTDYVYNKGTILYSYVGAEAYETEVQANTIAVSGRVFWNEASQWTDLVRPAELPADPETYLHLYSYTQADKSDKTQLKLQNTDSSKPNYIEWKQTSGEPYWNYTIKNVSQDTGMEFCVEGPAAGSYKGTTDLIDRDTQASQTEYRMGQVEYKDLVYEDNLFIQKIVIPETDTGKFTFTITAGKTADTIATNYAGNYTLGHVDSATGEIAMEEKSTSNGVISNIAGGDVIMLTEFPKGLYHKVVETERDTYITSYTNQIAVGNGETIVTNIKNDATAELTKVWNDNNSLTRSEAAFRASLELQYKVDDGAFTDMTAETQAKYGIGAVTFQITKTNYSTWAVAALNDGKKNFPAAYIDEDENVHLLTYKIAEKELTGYIGTETTSEDGKTVLTNTKTIDFNATLQWKDQSAVDERPVSTVEMLSGYYLNDKGETVTLTSEDWKSMQLSPEITVMTGDKNETGFPITRDNLPMYTPEGHLITYYVTAEAEEGYETTYDNGTGSHGTNVTECYDGGTVIQTIMGEVEYAATKVWADDAEDALTRPTATMYLYRYSEGGNVDTASPVVIVDNNKKNHVLKYEIPADSSVNEFPISFAEQLNGIAMENGSAGHLDQYDEDGRAYTYFVKEVLSGNNSSFYAKKYTNPDSDEKGGALNGGTVTNTRIELIDVNIQKSWKTASYPDVPKDTTVTYVIQEREAGTEDPWTDALDDEGQSLTVTLDGFSAEVLTKESTLKMPKYNQDGQVLEYKIVETQVKKGETVYNVTDNVVTIEGHDYEFVSDSVSMADAEGKPGEKSIDLSGMNRLLGKLDYTVIKIWQPEPTSGQDQYTASVKLERYLYDGTVDPSFDQTYVLKYTDKDAGVSWSHIFKDLPLYDEDGYQYSYKAVETGFTPAINPESGKGWGTTYSYDSKNNKATIKNYEPGDSIQIKVSKAWRDDGDVQHRQPVVAALFDAEGNPVDVAQVELNDGNEWTGYITVNKSFDLTGCTVKELTVGGNTVQYTGEVEGYTASADKGYVTTDEADGHIYMATSEQDATDGSWMLYNTRKGRLSITVQKTWRDGNRANDERPTISFTLKQEDAVIQTVTDLKADPETVIEDNTWTYTFADLEKYDDKGVLYTYKVDEIDSAALKAQDYVSKTVEGDYDLSASKYHSGDTKTYSITNTRKGTTDYIVYKKWKDVATTTRRPDIYVKLFYQVPGDTTYYAYGTGPDKKNQTSELDYIWYGGSGAEFDSYCKVDQLNKYTDDGSLISYYAKEYINVPGDYKTYYWTDKNLDTADANNKAGYAGDLEYIENRLESTIQINGVKTWKNLQVGTDSKDIDTSKVKISLYRAVGSETPELVATTAGLQDNNTSFQFTRGTEGAFADQLLSKYDRNGALYQYTILETIEGNMGLVYSKDPNGFQMTNTFVTTDPNLRTISVEKTWDAAAYTSAVQAGQNAPVYPDLTFELYRSSGTNTDGNEIDYTKDPIATLVVSTESGQTTAEGSFPRQLVWSENGVPYKYAVKERVDAVPGYEINKSEATQEIVDADGAFTEDARPDVRVSFENVYTPITAFQLEGSKIWNDANLSDLRPDAVSLKVYRYTATMGSQTEVLPTTGYQIDWKRDAAANKWTYTITGDAIVKYAPDGQAWNYKVVEDPVDTSYKAENGGSASLKSATDAVGTMEDLTNSLKSSFVVTKKWADNSNEYGLRPLFSYVKLQRQAEGETEWEDVMDYTDTADLIDYDGVKVVKLSYDANKWTHTYEHLAPENAAGKAFAYRAVEVAIGISDTEIYATRELSDNRATKAGSYKITYEDTANEETHEGATTITNTLESTSLTVTKNWVDHSNQYDSRPINAAGTPEIIFTLEYSTDTEADWDSRSWETMKDVSGNPITRKISGSADTVTHTFDNLPSCDYSGNQYAYRAVENTDALVENYEPTYVYKDKETGITNTLRELTADHDVTATKVWHDGNQANHTAIFELLRYVGDDKTLTEYTERKLITLDGTADGNGEVAPWKAEWKNLPDKMPNGDLITYKVREVSINSANVDTMDNTYGVETTQADGTNDWTITNTKLMSYKVTKTFQNDTYNVRPKQLYVKLERKLTSEPDTAFAAIDGTFKAGATNVASTGGEYHWTGSAATNELGSSMNYIFTNLPKYNADGAEYTYRVRESSVTFSAANGGGSYPISDDSVLIAGYDITNTDNAAHTQTDIVNKMETVNVTGTKTWEDTQNGVDYSGTYRPGELAIKVYKESTAGLVEVKKQPTPVWTKSDGVWTFTIRDLPLYNPDGSVIQYHVQETSVPTAYIVSNNDLSSTFTEDSKGTTVTLTNGANTKGITNTLQTADVTGTKTWVHTMNGQGIDIQPTDISLTLYQSVNGEARTEVTNPPAPTWIKTSTTSWSYTFADLPSVDPAGDSITYSVSETAVPGYTTTYSSNNLDITNTLDTVDLTATKTWNDRMDQFHMRPSGWNTDGKAGLYNVYADSVLMDPQPDKTWVQRTGSTTVWDFKVEGLQAKKADGTAIVYTVQEQNINGYTADGTAPNYVNNLETVSFEGTKIWEDESNAFHTRPTDITLTIQGKAGSTGTWAKITGNPVFAWDKTTNQDTWGYEINYLPKYSTDGQLMYYRVVESAVNGYTSDQGEGVEGTRDADGNVTGADITNTYTAGGLTINKVYGEVNANTGTKPIATFQITSADRIIGEIKTNAAGAFPVNADGSYTDTRDTTGATTFRLLLNQAYTIQEMGTDNTNYTVEGTAQSFTLTAENSTYTVQNDTTNHVFRNGAKRGTLQITKLDEKYEIVDGALVEKTGAGTKLDGADFIVVLAGDPTKMITHLQKNGDNTGEYILPATADTTAVTGYTAVANNELGIAYLYNTGGTGKLLYGDYKVIEVTPPTGYEMDLTPTAITIGTDAAAAVVGVPNTMIEQTFKINKKYEAINAEAVNAAGTMTEADATDHIFTFTVTRTAQSTPAFAFSVTRSTDAAGVADFGSLPYGTYTVTETANNTYVTPEIQSITVDVEGVHYKDNRLEDGILAVENMLKRGTITGEKVDAASQEEAIPVEGAIIGLFDSAAEDASPLLTDETDEDGIYSFTNVPYGTTGTYYVKEIQAPDNYQLSSAIKTVQFVMTGVNGQTITLNSETDRIEDTPVYADLKLYKTDVETEAEMSEVAFTLEGTDWLGNTVKKEGQTNESGTLTLENIPVGAYVLTETKVTNYEEPEQFLVTVTNSRDEETKINTAVLTMANKATEEVLSADETTGTYSITNQLIKREFSFIKYGTNDEIDLKARDVLAGSEFGLYDTEACDGEPLAKETSKEDGKVTFRDVTCGTFYIKELVPTKNYTADKAVYEVTVGQDGTVSSELETCINEAIRGSFTMTKVNEADPTKVVPGSTYTLYKRVPVKVETSKAKEVQTEDIYVAEAVTDDNGKITFNNLLIGTTYIVKETKAPEGYQVSKNPITLTFTLDEEKESAKLNVANTGDGTVQVDKDGNIIWLEPPTKVSIEKVDEAGKGLSGAKLQLTDEKGNVIDTWTTDGKAHVLEAVLAADQKYTLTELKAPTGYDVAKAITFTVENVVQTPGTIHEQKVTMTDKKTKTTATNKNTSSKKTTTTTKKSAKTGDTANAMLWMAMMLFAASGAVVVTRRKKKVK